MCYLYITIKIWKAGLQTCDFIGLYTFMFLNRTLRRYDVGKCMNVMMITLFAAVETCLLITRPLHLPLPTYIQTYIVYYCSSVDMNIRLLAKRKIHRKPVCIDQI